MLVRILIRDLVTLIDVVIILILVLVVLVVLVHVRGARRGPYRR